jgi:hypothetical protein
MVLGEAPRSDFPGLAMAARRKEQRDSADFPEQGAGNPAGYLADDYSVAPGSGRSQAVPDDCSVERRAAQR